MNSSTRIYAHTLPEHGEEAWELLYGDTGHAKRVAELCSQFTSVLTPQNTEILAQLGYILGAYHDMGKAGAGFQNYIKKSAAGLAAQSVDHKSAAAKWAAAQKSPWDSILPYVFDGHHSGLPYGVRLWDKLDYYQLDDALLQVMPDEIGDLELGLAPAIMNGCKSQAEYVFALSFFVRMLHSCLIDADWLATEQFMESDRADARAQKPYDSIGTLSARLELAIAKKVQGATGLINELRSEIHTASYAAAARPAGVYRLNVPTGGGKTLSSLSFALRHAQQHGLQRVIYVIPYTSIIEQTVSEFRKILGEDQVLEHHSNLSELSDTDINRFASENWDAPLIVTTNVQFFESLFSHRNKSARKLHNIARSVIIFDEVQTLPCDFLAPCLAAMKTLQRDYGASLVLCTATQPALMNRAEHNFEIGWDSQQLSSLLGDELEQRLAAEMKRVEIELLGTISMPELTTHFAQSGLESALFIVNLTRQAQDLYQSLSDMYPQEALYHLSARMCPAHRARQLEALRARLAAGLATILVATRVVEAGVDISFPTVYRDRCGLDSLAQSAGRCNRHGELACGYTYAFSAAEQEYKLPLSFVDLSAGAIALRDVIDLYGADDLLSGGKVDEYFKRYYAAHSASGSAWDRHAILSESIPSSVRALKAINYPEIGDKFKLIPAGQHAVMMPYGEDARLLRVQLLQLQSLGVMPSRLIYRRVARCSVNVYASEYAQLRPRCECIHKEADIWMLSQDGSYDESIGLMREVDDMNYIF